MKILVVDDEVGKRAQVVQFLTSLGADLQITEARSFQSAMEELKKAQFEWVVLDMRLTTYDVSTADDGGRPRNFGGDEVLRKMKRKGIVSKVLVLTQYSVFRVQSGVLTIDQLKAELEAKYSFFKGLVFFQHSTNIWQEQLRRLVVED